MGYICQWISALELATYYNWGLGWVFWRNSELHYVQSHEPLLLQRNHGWLWRSYSNQHCSNRWKNPDSHKPLGIPQRTPGCPLRYNRPWLRHGRRQLSTRNRQNGRLPAKAREKSAICNSPSRRKTAWTHERAFG